MLGAFTAAPRDLSGSLELVCQERKHFVKLILALGRERGRYLPNREKQ
jgi:hypothetical protein